MRAIFILFVTVIHFSWISEGHGKTNRIFVTNEASDTVSVIDIKSEKVIKEIAVGKRPRGIGISPSRHEIYVAISAENKIAVIDPISLKIIRSFACGDDPETFSVHGNGNIYISNEEDAKASVYTPEGVLLAEIEVGIEPEGVAISPNGDTVIVTSESSNMLHIIDIPSHKIRHNVLVGARPRSVAFGEVNQIAYATSEITSEIRSIDTVNGTTLNKTQLADSSAKPKDIIIIDEKKLAFVAGGRSNKVFVMNTETFKIENTISVGGRVWGLAKNNSGRKIYSTDGLDHQVSVIDVEKLQRINTIKVGKFPWGILVDD